MRRAAGDSTATASTATSSAATATRQDTDDVDQLEQRFDLSMRLTSDEIAELTERVLEASRFLTSADEDSISLESFIRVLEPHQRQKEVIDEAVAGLLRTREKRLSNVIARKVHELERMLFALLPRFDAPYGAEVRYPLPTTGGAAARAPRERSEVEFRLRADKGRLEVEVRHWQPTGVVERLFTVTVRTARRPSLWERIFESRPSHQPKEIAVRTTFFSGRTLDDLLTWTLLEKNAHSERGLAAGFALGKMHSAIVEESESAMRYVSELRFEVDN